MRRSFAVAVLCAYTAYFVPRAFAGENECLASAKAIPLCTVLSDSSKYDGKEITIRGLYRMAIHGSVLMSSACSQTYVNMRRSSDEKPNKHAMAIIRSLTKKDQFTPVDVVLRGKFRVSHQGCFGQNCLLYEIEETQLLCAAQVKPSSSAGPTAPKGGVMPTPAPH
jgi:hypothetical protein